MRKSSLFLVVALFAFMPQSYAQSMTDAEVLDFAREQKEAGQSESAIVTELMKRGVTVSQLRQIRDKVNAGNSQLGAVDLTGKQNSVNRSRIDRQISGEEYQQRNNYMMRSYARGKDGTDNMTDNEKRELFANEIKFLDIDSLLYFQDILNSRMGVFGHDIFSNPNLSFEPNFNMATPSDYVLGAGDVVILDIWGASQESIESEISPDGIITVDGIGPVSISGMTVEQASKTLSDRLGTFYGDSQFSLSLGRTRSVHVQVIGEVNMPGTYSISALSSPFNALYLAGGISDIGTLRDIKLFRNGKVLDTIDVYDFLQNGNTGKNVRLQDNDIIVVGTYKEMVKVTGSVKRPMYYEMLEGENVQFLLDLSGGFASNAFRKNVRIERKSGGDGYSVHTVQTDDFSSFTLSDGDLLYVDSISLKYSNMVELRGAVYHPGMYQLGEGISGVRDLIEMADGLLEDAFQNRAVIHRQKSDLSLEVISVNLKGILDGSSTDVVLKNNDVLFVPSIHDMLNDRTLTINGEVAYPGTYMFAENSTVEDLVLQAGGLTDKASTVKVDVFRRIYDPSASATSDTVSQVFSLAMKDGFVVDGEPGFRLEPYDQVVIRRSPLSSDLQFVTVSGSVNFAGTYAMTTKTYRLSDLINAAGGLSKQAYPHGAHLERTMTEEEQAQRQTSLKNQQIALYESNFSSAKKIDMQMADTLMNMKLDLGNKYPVAIDLSEALDNPGGENDIVLRENDVLVVPQYSSTVKVSGEVMYPISLNYKKGASLKYYINRAGGYADKANVKRIYAIYMNGSVRSLKRHGSKEITPGCEIVIPSKENREKLTTAEWLGMGTTAASITTMILSIASLLK